MAALDDGPQTVSNPIVFDYSFINPDDHYDNTTGIYTVPLDGIYEFYVIVYCSMDADCYMYINIDDDLSYFTRTSRETEGHHSMSATPTIHLTAGQEVSISPVVSGTYSDLTVNVRCWFSGHLLFAD